MKLSDAANIMFVLTTNVYVITHQSITVIITINETKEKLDWHKEAIINVGT